MTVNVTRWQMMDPMLVLQDKQERERRQEMKRAAAIDNLKALFGEPVNDPDRIDFRFRISTELNDRLENWGRLSRVPSAPGLSMTGIICHRLAVHAGAYKYDGPLPPTDDEKADALLIERAWRGQMPMKQKTLLAGYYVYRVRPERLVRVVSIRLREFDQQMFIACNMIENIARRLAIPTKVGHNHGDNLATGP